MVLDITKCHAGGLDISEACVDGVCQHHGAAYAEWTPPAVTSGYSMEYEAFSPDTQIVSVQIVTSKRCCIVVNAASIASQAVSVADIEIERPTGTIKTTQADGVITGTSHLMHHAAWEVLAAGTYTYYLMQRSGFQMNILAAWIKAVASDCEG